MIENVKTEKKVWVAPALEELAIDKTLGGRVLTATESFFGNGDINPGGGSVFPQNR